MARGDDKYEFVNALIDTTTCLKVFHGFMKERDILPTYLEVHFDELLFMLRRLNTEKMEKQQSIRFRAMVGAQGVSEISETSSEINLSDLTKKDPDGIDMFWSAIKESDSDDESTPSLQLSTTVPIHVQGEPIPQEPMFDDDAEGLEELEISYTDPDLNEEDYKTSNKKRPYQCNLCKKNYKTFASLTSHLRKHEPHRCPICQHEFSHYANVKVHMRIHSGAKPFECKTCHKRFRQSNTCKDHERIHTGEKPFQCEVCGNNFARRYSLNLHRRRIHTGEKPHICATCGQRFASSSQLQRHTMIHTGEKPHLCDICSAGFTTRTDLKKHMVKHNKSKMVFTL